MTSVTLAWNAVVTYLICDRHVQECNISSRHLYENPTQSKGTCLLPSGPELLEEQVTKVHWITTCDEAFVFPYPFLSLYTRKCLQLITWKMKTVLILIKQANQWPTRHIQYVNRNLLLVGWSRSKPQPSKQYHKAYITDIPEALITLSVKSYPLTGLGGL
jgi:hypothetical protein